MKVILLSDQRHLGQRGQTVEVKPGYGRNYLVPHGKAIPVTEASLADFEKRRAEYEARANTSLAEATSRKEALESTSVTIRANASTEGKLYGSVGPRDVAEAFSDAGFPLEKSEVILPEGPLRRVGEFDVTVSMHADVQCAVKVIVVPDN